MEPIEQIAKHVEILNEEVGLIQIDVAAIKVNISWLKKLGFWQLGLVGTLLLGALSYIIFV